MKKTAQALFILIASLVSVSAETIAVHVTPSAVNLGEAQTQEFRADVTGTENTAVQWSVNPPIGAISNLGIYAAPPTIPMLQKVKVTATSVEDTSQAGRSVITLMPPASTPMTHP